MLPLELEGALSTNGTLLLALRAALELWPQFSPMYNGVGNMLGIN